MKTMKKYAMGGAVTTTTDKTTNKPVSNKSVEFKKTARDKEIEKTNKGNASGVRAKNGKSFPDLNKDGKITKADVLKGRGVIAKKGAKIAKCKYGCK